MKTKKNEAKTTIKHISCDCKCKFTNVACNWYQKWNNKTRQCEYKNYGTCKIDFDIDNILIHEKSHENILIYGILYKTLIGWKPLRIRFNKIDGSVRIYDKTRY